MQSQLAREFNHRRQFLRLIGKILLRWVASLILSIAMVIAFYQYEKVKILDTKAKRWFNAVSTGLYLTASYHWPDSFASRELMVFVFPLFLLAWFEFGGFAEGHGHHHPVEVTV